MEKKETKRSHYSFRSVSGLRYAFSNLLGRFNFSKNNIGLTLIELLIVVAILGILAASLTLVINPANRIAQARDTQRKSDFHQIQTALETYYNDHGYYPSSAAGWIKDGTNPPMNWGNTGWSYMSTLPKDPSFGRYYVYISTPWTTNQTYYLYASLETANGTCFNNISTKCAQLQTGPLTATLATCGVICNYGVSSPNTSP